MDFPDSLVLAPIQLPISPIFAEFGQVTSLLPPVGAAGNNNDSAHEDLDYEPISSRH